MGEEEGGGGGGGRQWMRKRNHVYIFIKKTPERWQLTDMVDTDASQRNWLKPLQKTHKKDDPDNNRNKSRYFSSSSSCPLVFFFFLLSLFSMLQCYSERDASAHALPEREGVNGWRDEEERWSVCTCVCYGEVERGSAALTRCLSGSVCVFKACVFL